MNPVQSSLAVTTTREEFRALAAEHRVVPVTRKVLADSETPLSAYRKLAADRPGPTAYRAVGYLARGPVAGPLVVASFKATDQHQDWRGDHDLNALLALNVKQ